MSLLEGPKDGHSTVEGSEEKKEEEKSLHPAGFEPITSLSLGKNSSAGLQLMSFYFSEVDGTVLCHNG